MQTITVVAHSQPCCRPQELGNLGNTTHHNEPTYGKEAWSNTATCWFIILEAQLSRQGLRVALEVSDVTPYDYLKEAILRRTQPAKGRARNTWVIQTVSKILVDTVHKNVSYGARVK